MSKIITRHVYPPIPIRCYDWEAIREDYDEGDIVGWGELEKDAIDDLIEQEIELNDINKKESTENDIQIKANKIIEIMQNSDLTPDQILAVIKNVRERISSS